LINLYLFIALNSGTTSCSKSKDEEFMAVMDRIQGYLNSRVGIFKVSKLFIRNERLDEEAIEVLRDLLKSPLIWRNILDVQCNVKFQLNGDRREVILSSNSIITSIHCESMWSNIVSRRKRRSGLNWPCATNSN